MLLAGGVAGLVGAVIRDAFSRHLDPAVDWGTGAQIAVQVVATAVVMALLLWLMRRMPS
ncbi:hypothetical protein [Methylobacterium nodulans]|uniref:Uncharacterized protein n=1 Tax=Methylobacterium nodulans (strain LMG 21967 / CNCM I-2342 / ORS 2060) TaxID=460265 RepID=B8I9W1_METNO|nr:hypothetical protein [Methylobacterium nodulans]ACL57189.1 conserved hypothetical protein [Methylobacterium nodulans ORS 2060]